MKLKPYLKSVINQNQLKGKIFLSERKAMPYGDAVLPRKGYKSIGHRSSADGDLQFTTKNLKISLTLEIALIITQKKITTIPLLFTIDFSIKKEPSFFLTIGRIKDHEHGCTRRLWSVLDSRYRGQIWLAPSLKYTKFKIHLRDNRCSQGRR